jgi:hypothetical protein
VLLNSTIRGLRGATSLCFQIIIELPLVPASTSLEEIDDKQQDDGSSKRQQNGRNGNGRVDPPNMEDTVEEVTSQEYAQDGHNYVDDQVRAVVHD